MRSCVVASSVAMARPIPRLAPVMMAVGLGTVPLQGNGIIENKGQARLRRNLHLGAFADGFHGRSGAGSRAGSRGCTLAASGNTADDGSADSAGGNARGGKR